MVPTKTQKSTLVISYICICGFYQIHFCEIMFNNSGQHLNALKFYFFLPDDALCALLQVLPLPPAQKHTDLGQKRLLK